jgi:hypothetical protein
MRATVDKIANAVLYEGYLLYPYRRSSLKNRQPWSFGTLPPRRWAEANGETYEFRSECMAEAGADARISGRVRFLHVGHVSGDTARERTVEIPEERVSDLLVNAIEVPFVIDGDTSSGHAALAGNVAVAAERVNDSTAKIKVRVQNLTIAAEDAVRDTILPLSMVAAHAVLEISGGEFVSLLDPPEALRDAVANCANSGVFPVLAGEAGQRNTMLLSPIILYDYPQVAAESPGDFFDSSEIDEMLTLRVLTLSEDEKQEIRNSNNRARAILERTEAMPSEQLLKLHGVLRGLRRAGEGQQR